MRDRERRKEEEEILKFGEGHRPKELVLCRERWVKGIGRNEGGRQSAQRGNFCKDNGFTRSIKG